MSYQNSYVYWMQAVMAGNQAAAGTLKATLGSRSAHLTEQDYSNLIEQGLNSPEALLGARDKSFEAILVRRGAVDAVLAWQAESKPKRSLGKWQCISWVIAILKGFICRHSPLLVRMPVGNPSYCLHAPDTV